MTLRIDESSKAACEGDQVEIGGDDRYVATCRRHFKLGEAVFLVVSS